MRRGPSTACSKEAALRLPLAPFRDMHHVGGVRSKGAPAPSRRAAVKQFFVELKRRKVYRMATAYIVVALF